MGGAFPPAQFGAGPPAFPPPAFLPQGGVPVQAAPTDPAPVNPLAAAAASANPFAKAAGSNPFGGAGFKPKEFKMKDPRAIMDDDDDAPFDFAAGAAKKKKQKTQAELDEEKRKAKEEEDAKLSYKGKPSEFFIMDFVPGDLRDPTGNNRVPTQ